MLLPNFYTYSDSKSSPRVNVWLRTAAETLMRLLFLAPADDQANSSETKGEDKFLREIFSSRAQVVLAFALQLCVLAHCFNHSNAISQRVLIGSVWE